MVPLLRIIRIEIPFVANRSPYPCRSFFIFRPMKNVNYNLMKLLHETQDNLWRIEQHYLRDADGAACDCGELLGSMRDQLLAQADALRAELASHMEEDRLA